MGLKPAQGELNAALRPLFAHIDHVHLIHDDITIATQTEEEHEQAIMQVMEVVKESGLTLNPDKCIIGQSEVKFWGMIYGEDGVRPDPEKVSALQHNVKKSFFKTFFLPIRGLYRPNTGDPYFFDRGLGPSKDFF